MRITTLALLGLGFGLGLSQVAGCRDGGNGDQVDAGVDPDAPPGDTGDGSVRIQDVQSDSMPVGTLVKVKGVVVTAIDEFGARTGDLFVQDPAGGPFSGVKVFMAPLDQVAMLAVGDLVDIEGAAKDEFRITGATRTLTELKPASQGSMRITKKGTGAVPAPAVVDAAAISLLDKAARDAEWEKWEGVLITVTNARQTGPFGTFSGGAPDQGEFRISGLARVQSSLAKLPATNAFGKCYERVTGLGDYAFNDLVLPRSEADIVEGGTGCRPLSTSAVAAQTQVSPEAADLTNVFVTARDDIGTSSKGIWVADSLTAAPNNGIFVFTGANLAANLVVGATVSVQGTIDEFDLAQTGMPLMGDTVTEVTGGTPVLVAAPTVPPTPMVVAPGTLSDIGAPGEAYEGVLVQVDTVKVTAAQTGGKFELTANDGSKIIMDDESFVPTVAPTVGTCYGSVVGVMHVQPFDNVRTINPRMLADLVLGMGCN
jgi:predicted extracellular nuclease